MHSIASAFSSQSSDTLVTEQVSVRAKFEVQRLPLKVIVVIAVNRTMENRLTDVKEEEGRNHRVHESDPVLGEPEVNEAISLEGNEGVPQSQGGWSPREGYSSLAETLDVLVDVAHHLGLHLHALDHLHDLLLLLVSGAVLHPNLLQALADVVVETLRHLFIIY